MSEVIMFLKGYMYSVHLRFNVEEYTEKEYNIY